MLRKGHILVIAVIVVSFVTFSVNEAYAIQVEDKKPAGSNRMDWGVIFVTSFQKCSDNNWKALDFYYFIAWYSIQQYGYPNAITFADCISKNDYLGNIKQYQDYLDLPIIVLDYQLSTIQRHSTNSKGHFSTYSVTNIITQAKTFSIEDQDSAWTLSHEIAHSSLHWKNYDKKVWADFVHEIESAYRVCKNLSDNYDVALSSCQPLWTTAKTPSDDRLAIMSLEPYLVEMGKKQKTIDDEKRIRDEQKAYEEQVREAREQAREQNQRDNEIRKSTEERLAREQEKREFGSRYDNVWQSSDGKNYEECLAFAVDKNSCAFLRPNNYQKPTYKSESVVRIEPVMTEEQQAYYDAQEQFKLNRQLKQWEDERKLQLENNPIREPSDFVFVDPKETKETHTSTYILKKPAEPNYFSDFMSQIQDFFSSLRWG